METVWQGLMLTGKTTKLNAGFLWAHDVDYTGTIKIGDLYWSGYEFARTHSSPEDAALRMIDSPPYFHFLFPQAMHAASGGDYSAIISEADAHALEGQWVTFSQVVRALSYIDGDTVSKDDLLNLADMRNERPRFLFPNDSPPMGLCNLVIPSGLDQRVADRLQLMNDAVDHFWEGVTEETWEQPATRKGKDKASIQAWLISKGMGKTQAMYIDVLIRPEFAARGGNVKLKGQQG